MRDFFTIFQYELLMHFKSIRYKAVCGLALFFALQSYLFGIKMQELNPTHTFLDDGSMIFYFAVIISTGVFSIGRIKSTGMHSILFNRHFQTFNLMLGQVSAGLISLLLPISIIFFPAGLILRMQFDIDFPIPPLLYALIFNIIPMIFVLLSLTIWIRTCFKNNIMTFIIIGLILSGIQLLSESPLVRVGSPETGMMMTNFIPIVNPLSVSTFEEFRNLWSQPVFSFLQPMDWIHFGLNILYSLMFLIFACFHLRRTEPQRKILEDYGQHWYHTPTFLKMACDLKVDPHIKKKTKFFVFLLVLFLIGKSLWAFWPFLKPKIEQFWVEKVFENEEKKKQKEEFDRKFTPKFLSDQDLVPIQILNDKQVISQKSFSSEILFSVTGDISQKVAPLPAWKGLGMGYQIDQILVDDQILNFAKGYENYIFYLEGKNLQKFADGQPHLMKILTQKDSKIQQGQQDVLGKNYYVRGFYFAKRVKKEVNSFEYRLKESWPIQIFFELDEGKEVFSSPVPPETRIMDGKKYVYFDIPREKSGGSASFFVAPKELYSVLSVPNFENIKVLIFKSDEKIMTQILDALSPVAIEFCDLWGIGKDEQLFLSLKDNSTSFGYYDVQNLAKNIGKYSRIFSQTGSLKWQKDHFLMNLMNIEELFLKQILYNYLYGNGRIYQFDTYDLFNFISSSHNLFSGLNSRLTLDKNFIPRTFINQQKVILLGDVAKVKDLNRKDFWKDYRDRVGIFQMLYLTMGHEKWMEMFNELHKEMNKEFFSEVMLQNVVEKVTGESYSWFFDYWFRTGTGYPSYKIESATAEILSNNQDETTEYLVVVRISNVGTGRMLVPLILDTAKNNEEYRIWIGSGETVEWSTVTKFLPQEIMVDLTGWITTIPYFDSETNRWVQKVSAKIKVEKTKE